MIQGLALNPAGDRMVSCSKDGTAIIWSVLDGSQINVLSESLAGVAITPDGARLAGACADGTIKFWAMADAQAGSTLRGHTAGVNAIAITADGKWLLSGSTDKSAILYSLPQGKGIRHLQGHSGAVRAVAVSPDGKLMATGGEDKIIKLWSVSTGKLLKNLTGHTASVRTLVFTPNSKMLASGSLDRTIRLWAMPDGKAWPRLIDLDASSRTSLAVKYRWYIYEYWYIVTVPVGVGAPAGATVTCASVGPSWAAPQPAVATARVAAPATARVTAPATPYARATWCTMGGNRGSRSRSRPCDSRGGHGHPSFNSRNTRPLKACSKRHGDNDGDLHDPIQRAIHHLSPASAPGVSGQRGDGALSPPAVGEQGAALRPYRAIPGYHRVLGAGSASAGDLGAAGAHRPTEAVLLMTGACNLRCVYCYAHGGEDSRLRMSLPLAKTIIDRAAANALAQGRSRFRLVFHGGGEPTLNWDVLVGAVEHARTKRVPCHVSMSSNGLWTGRQRSFILANFQGLSISFDGIPRVQNAQRPRPGGGASFSAVMESMQAMDKSGFRYGVRMTVLPPSMRHLAAGVQLLCERTHCGPIQVEPAYTDERGSYADPTGEQGRAFVTAFMGAFRVAQRAGRRLGYPGARLATLCGTFCHAGAEAFVTTPEGDLVSCYEMHDRRHPFIDRFVVGHASPGRVRFDYARLRDFADWQNRCRESCRGCFCYWHCAGDCAARRIGVPENRGGRCEVNRQITAQLLAWYIARGGGVWNGLATEDHGETC